MKKIWNNRNKPLSLLYNNHLIKQIQMTPEKPYLTTNEMIKELNKRGYVAVLFYHETWCVEGEKPIPIGYVQSQVESSFYHEFDDVYGDIMETIYYDDDWM